MFYKTAADKCWCFLFFLFVCLLFFLLLFFKKIKLDVSCELSALIQFFFFFLKNKKLNTLLELYFIFPLLGKGLFSVR